MCGVWCDDQCVAAGVVVNRASTVSLLSTASLLNATYVDVLFDSYHHHSRGAVYTVDEVLKHEVACFFGSTTAAGVVCHLHTRYSAMQFICSVVVR
jgi:hypothetical protein